jgi:hypothetical protein
MKSSPRLGLPARMVALLAWVVFAVVCGGIYVAAQTRDAETKTGPRLVVGPTSHDFGTVTAGTVLQHEFAVSNRGTTRVVLNQDTCCGGDVIESHVLVPPGGQVRIPVKLSTAGIDGKVQREVNITTSDPRRPRVQFTLTAHVLSANQ